MEFVAVTVNVYEVPFVSPVTVNGLEEPVAVNDPGLEVTVYPVIDAPPVAPAVNGTEIAPLAPVALGVPTVGA